VGYAGGHANNPTYKSVCADRTGHAEAVEMTFDPAVVSYEALLDIFWKAHNPTTVNRQGPDVGSQYRSVIFYYTDAQKKAAEASKTALNHSGKLRAPVVTEIVKMTTFWPAEEYHQNYAEKTGSGGCHLPQ
jgi:peptide-methionine (S)-S-oxide reductase